MKEEKIINNNVSEQKEVKGLDSIYNDLDNMGILVDKIEAFNQLINNKLDEVQNPHTEYFKKECNIDSLALDIFKMQSNISNYIMLSYSISDFTIKLNEMIQDIYKRLQEISK